MGNVAQVADLHVLSYDQRERLEQFNKLLTNMEEPRIAAGCFENGYSAAAHAKGVELYDPSGPPPRPHRTATETPRARGSRSATGPGRGRPPKLRESR